MVKKLILLAFSLAFSAGLFAQSGDATIAPSQIKFWVGSGSNEVVFAVNFGDPDTCIAWGFRFTSDSVTVEELMDSIVAADYRFSYSGSGGVMNTINFTPTRGMTFDAQANNWMYNVNGDLANWGYTQQYVKDGDFVKWGDGDVATYTQTTGWPWVFEWSQTVNPVGVPDATIDPTKIKYWIGNGNNEVVFAANWANPDTCLAWGYRFSSDSIIVSDMMTDIANADYRFSFDSASGWLLDIVFINGTDTLKKASGSYWMYNVNGVAAQNLFTSQYVKDGDFVKFGDVSVAVVNDTDSWGYPSDVAWIKPVTPVYAPDALIDASNIVYWVGTGSNEVVFATNWANPDTCLAWGYRFSSDSILVSDMMTDIANADYRFSFDSASGWLLDIVFINGTDTLKKASGSYWMYNVNGVAAQNLFTSQYVKDNDFVKFGDVSVAVVNDTDSWGYPSNVVWTTTVDPVSVPSGATPTDATIAASDIIYWVGTGSNEVIFAVNWATPDTCLAWGYRFSSDSVTVAQVIGDIAAADPRFSYDSSMAPFGAFMNDIYFAISANDTLKRTGSYWMYNVNGVSAMVSFDAQYVKNNDFIKFGDESVGVMTDTVMYFYVWTKTVTPVSIPQGQQSIVTANALNFNVYPNPATTQATIAVEGAGKGTQIVLLDVCGKELYRTDAENDGNYTVNVSALPKGVYFVSVRNNDAATTTKLIVK